MSTNHKNINPQLSISRLILALCFLGIGITYDLAAQETITWEDLTDVEFEEKYDEETEAFWLVPIFGDQIKKLSKKEVLLEGFLIVLDMESNIVVLSRYPYSSCFFCGMAGPESIVEIQLSEPPSNIKMDQKAVMQGSLHLNSTELNHFNYILKEAVIAELK